MNGVLKLHVNQNLGKFRQFADLKLWSKIYRFVLFKKSSYHHVVRSGAAVASRVGSLTIPLPAAPLS